jgi:hypothetical protein
MLLVIVLHAVVIRVIVLQIIVRYTLLRTIIYYQFYRVMAIVYYDSASPIPGKRCNILP